MSKRSFTIIAVLILLLSTLASIDALYNHTGERINLTDTSNITNPNKTMPEVENIIATTYSNATAVLNTTIKANGTGTNHSSNRSFNADTANEVTNTKGATVESTTIHVPVDCDTIQAAINHSSSGTTIIVSPKSETDNVYNEGIEINESLSNINLIANGTVVINCRAGDQIRVKAEGCTIRGFHITAGGQYGAYHNQPYAGIRLCSNNNTAKDNYIYCTCEGIAIDNASYNTIENNTITYCLGLMSIWGDHNFIADNTFGDDSGSGWKLGAASIADGSTDKPASQNTIKSNIFTNSVSLKGSDNLIYDNKFLHQNVTLGSKNTYNLSKTQGTNILGGPYLGGNYWSNYKGNDSDGDGIGDIPYFYDQLPLVMLKPDLVVTGIAGGQIVVNTTNAISVTVANKGSDASSFNVSLNADDVLIGTETIDSLPGYKSTTTVFSWRPTVTGNYTRKAIADPDNDVPEFNETNNELEAEITVLIRVTVVINDADQNIYIQELPLPENTSVLNATELACVAQNLSFNESKGIVTEIDGLENPQLFLYDDALEQWTIAGIDHKLESSDVIGWSNENDLPTMLPDLTVDDIVIASGVGFPNIPNKIRVPIRNDGFADASNVSVVFKVNDAITGNETIECINPGATTNISFGWTPEQTGSYKLSVVVDPENTIAELNETNNYITKTVTVELPPAVVHASSITELQDMIDVSPVVVASHGWMTIYLNEGTYIEYEDEETEGNVKEGNLITITDKSNITIDGMGIARVGVVYTKTGDGRHKRELMIIHKSSNIELRGFAVVAATEKDLGSAHQNVQNIVIKESSNVTLINLELYHEGYPTDDKNIPIEIDNSENCTISKNFLSCRGRGIVLKKSGGNLLCNNTIIHNHPSWAAFDPYSIWLEGDSCNNTIYFNNLYGPAEDSGGCNYWNSSDMINYTYNGTTYRNYIGNHWNDYNGVDDNSDGIGDMPYGIGGDSGAFDYCPFMEPQGLSLDVTVKEIASPSMLYADRTNTILASVEVTETYPLPVQIRANLTANGEVADSKTIMINHSEHEVVRFEWTPQNTGIYRLVVSVSVEEMQGAIKEDNVYNNNLTIDAVEVASAPYNYTTNLASAVEFLNESQYPTGSISGFSNSGWAALGLVAAGEDPSTGIWVPYGHSLIGYLRNNSGDEVLHSPPGTNPPCLNSLEAIARMVMVISATAGKDPTNYGGVNYLVMLKSYYDGEQFGYNATVADDALAILALVACGDVKDKRVNGSVDYILAHQNSDGGWSDSGNKSSVDVTAYVIQALVAAGVDKESDALKAALEYTKNNQNDDGGYTNVRTTSSVIQAIIAAGDNPLSYTKNDINPLEYLLNLQQEDGSFNYSPDMSFFPPVSTTHTISALCGVPHPEMIRTGYQYEIPDVSVSQMVTEGEICVNTSYNVYAKIASNGGIFDVKLSSEAGFIQTKEVNSVWHESFSNVSFTWKPSLTGRFNLTVFADSNNRIEERSNANNNMTKSVEVVYPDLYPSAIEPPAISYVNVTNIINCTINGTTDEHFNVSLKEADGELVGEQRIEGIRDIISLSFVWRPSENRAYSLILTVDADNEVHERKGDTRNTLTKKVTVLLPDLFPANVSAAEGVYVNATNRIGVTVNGLAESFNVSLIENGTVVGKTCNVTCYGVADLTIFWKPTALGNHTVTGFVDSDNIIRESNEQNNNLTKVLDVRRSNLVPVELTPRVLYIDEVNTILVKVNGTADGFNATITVNGALNDTLNYTLNNTLNNTLIQKKTNLNTYNGSIEFEWIPTAFGDYNITVFLDSNDDINETDEANNNLTEVVHVRSRIALEQTTPVGGETWNGTQNISWNATYKDPVMIDLFYSPDRGYRWINIITNETNNGSYAWNTKDVIDGEYMIKVVARSGVVRAEDQSDIFYVINVASDTEWGSFHANAGYALSDAPAGPDIADYSDDIAAEGSASLIVARGKVFVYCTGWQGMYSDYTYLVALNQSNLKEVLWATQISPRVYGSWATPAYKDRSIFVTSGGSTGGGGYVYRIDADTGEIKWEFRFPGGYGSVNGGPAVTSRAVYVGDWNGKNYYSIDAATGNKTYWVFEVNGHSQSVPAIGYGNAYFGDAYNGSKTYCVDAWSGKEKWNRSVADGKNVCGTVTIVDNIVYFTTYDFNGPGIFYALDAYNGSIVWESVTERTDSTPAYKPPSKSVRAYVYVAGGYSTKEIICLDAKNGSIVWRVAGLGGWTNSPIVTKDGKVLVGKEGGGTSMIRGYEGLYCLDALTGEEKWHTERGGSSPVLVGGIAYTIGNDGRVYAIGKDGAPDLIVLDATADDTPYVIGKLGVITAVIKNIGKSDVTEEFYVELRESGVPLCNKTISGLNASDIQKVEFKWTPLTQGGHNLTIEVDPSPGVIPESNSLNNLWSPLLVEVEDNSPDLVAAIKAPNTIHKGVEVTIEANISNIGYKTNKSFWVQFCVDDVEEDGWYMSLDNDTQSNITNFNWIASGIGNYTLSVEANQPDKYTINESTWSNNINSKVVEVIEPTPTPTPSPGVGPGSGGGGGGGSAGGFGAGSGTGKSGAGETGGMQMPVNVSTSAAEETKHEVFGYPFGNISSGASGGGGTIPLLLVLVAIFIITVFYFGYYREKKSHAKHISLNDEGEEKQHRRIRKKK